MIIRDKQDLRRCVKQAVRRCEVVETAFRGDPVAGAYGVADMLHAFAPPCGTLNGAMEAFCGGGTPLDARAQEMLAALHALDLPVHDLDKAQAIVEGLDRQGHMARVLEAMRARRVFYETPVDRVQQGALPDERFVPVVLAGRALFAPGRYGVDYAGAAAQIAQAAAGCGAREITLEAWDAQALAYCALPLCEDERLTLHVHLEEEAQLRTLVSLLDAHPQAHVLASAQAEDEPALIGAAASRRNLLVRLTRLDRLETAILQLGTRFIPFASCAARPEEMLGRWVRAREVIWESLVGVYLQLARTGVELTREQIERDVEALLARTPQERFDPPDGE